MGGCKGPVTTFIVEPFIPHNEEFYLNVVSERLGNSFSFSECGGIVIEENWDKVKTIFVPIDSSFTSEACEHHFVYKIKPFTKYPSPITNQKSESISQTRIQTTRT
ncbi:ATP-citrate synthase alpha chain protein 1-like [Hibiscus syriacus]|uniref:ATP-citrate synthase alpha chain protein 1-like n=1 Tax=Hibiscus syriacus TaxID=106335 RepID=UPI0019227248|nr:ATP-citrate synthase alpha chain protein 1-like [Hibiscus syriacus]